MSKTVRIGNIWVNEINDKEGNPVKVPSIKLGNKGNKDRKYDVSVEIIVRDGNGNVIAKQTDGFVNMYEPTFNDKTPTSVKDALKYDLVLKRT